MIRALTEGIKYPAELAVATDYPSQENQSLSDTMVGNRRPQQHRSLLEATTQETNATMTPRGEEEAGDPVKANVNLARVVASVAATVAVLRHPYKSVLQSQEHLVQKAMFHIYSESRTALTASPPRCRR